MTDKDTETLESEGKTNEGAAGRDANSDPEIETGPEASENPESDFSESSEPDTPIELSREAWEELTRKAAKADECHDRLMRERADLENFKKRAARDRQDAIKFANEALVESLLPVLDNFEMAVLAMKNSEGSKEVETLKVGVEMIYGQLKNALGEAGLEEINAEGEMFDPKIHEAISQEETAEKPEGTVLSQTRKGYRLRDRMVRPVSVVVAVAKSADSEKAEESETD